jgi:hypothetical protein
MIQLILLAAAEKLLLMTAHEMAKQLKETEGGRFRWITQFV